MDLIHSKNELSLKASTAQLRGDLSRKVKALREEILYEIAFIESALDDPEHYDLTDYPEELRDKVNDMIGRVDDLIDSFNSGHILKEGINTLILGKPNAGKSSLLNTLIMVRKKILTSFKNLISLIYSIS